MAIFGRNTARQRLRRAAQESLRIPAFRLPPVDCAPWVTGGLWPAELSAVTPETAPLVRHLKADLQRIVDTANQQITSIRQAGLPDPERSAHEARIISEARGYALQRVESSVRSLRNRTSQAGPAVPTITGTAGPETTARFKIAAPQPQPSTDADNLAPATDFAPLPEADAEDRAQDAALAQPADIHPDNDRAADDQAPAVDTQTPQSAPGERTSPAPAAFDLDETTEIAVAGPPADLHTRESTSDVPQRGPGADPPGTDETVEFAVPTRDAFAGQPATSAAGNTVDADIGGRDDDPKPVTREVGDAAVPTLTPDDTDTITDLATLVDPYSSPLSPPVAAPTTAPASSPVSMFEPAAPDPGPSAAQRDSAAAPSGEPVDDDADTGEHAVPQPIWETEPERLRRLLTYAARQAPGLHWAIGVRHDGSALLVTDLAHGWIPPGVDLPAGVRLLDPGARHGSAAALLDTVTTLATYSPGDPLGWATDTDTTSTSDQPRALPALEDLGPVLRDATHWRDGLPRMVSTLARAAASGSGVSRAERGVLRGYLDAARSQLLAQYPAVNAADVLNCMLLAATDAAAGNDWLTANYHLSWFVALESHID